MILSNSHSYTWANYCLPAQRLRNIRFMIFYHRTIVPGIIYEVSLPKGYRHPGSAALRCLCGNIRYLMYNSYQSIEIVHALLLFGLPSCITIHVKFSIAVTRTYVYSHRKLQYFDTAAQICEIALFRDLNPENSCTFLIVLLILYMNPGDFPGFLVDVYLLIR